jgi:hypothetical protein
MGRCGGKRYVVKPGPWNHRSTGSIVRMTDQSNYKEKEEKKYTKREIERI